MQESFKPYGIFDVFDHDNLTNEQLLDIITWGGLHRSRHLRGYQRVYNTVMATQKLLASNAVWPNIDKLVITNQTGTPSDSETSYIGTIYTTLTTDEFIRSANVNPYQVGWNITASGANGNWGSFITITSSGTMINRALAGVAKQAGTGKLVLFTGSVT